MMLISIGADETSRSLTQIERARIALSHQLRHVDPESPTAASYLMRRAVEDFELEEKKLVRDLLVQMKGSPLFPLLSKIKGAGGGKAPARLVALLGNPYWNFSTDEPRTYDQLVRYCGLAPGQNKSRGEKAAWSHQAKMRLHIIAELLMKGGSPEWKKRYKDARKEYNTRPCDKCKARALKHAKGHAHAMALRKLAKAYLRQLWNLSRDVTQAKLAEAKPAKRRGHLQAVGEAATL